MKTCGFSFVLLTFLAFVLLACGSSSHMLQTVTVTPATADAQNFPSEQVQFTATGHFNSTPMSVSPLSATWGACFQSAATTAVTVTANGIAECTSGATGTFTIWAFSSNPSQVNCNAITACGGGCGRITGTAELTCP